MDLPVKRKNSSETPAESFKKRPSSDLLARMHDPFLKPANLSKNIWKEILDYIDTRSYCYIVPQINSFFNNIVKECKNNRKFLKLYFRFDSVNCEKHDNTRIEHILNCTQLKKLELKLFDCNSLSQFTKTLIQMPSIKTITQLKVSIRDKIEKLQNLLIQMENLQVLKLRTYYIHHEMNSFILKNYIHNIKDDNSSRTTLKKLSLYLDISTNEHGITKIIDSLDKNIGLEKLSIKNNENYPNEDENYNSKHQFKLKEFKANYYLKSLKLYDIYFDASAAESLLNFLDSTHALEELYLSEHIMIYGKSFYDALLINRSLKVLHIEPFLCDYVNDYKIETENVCGLLNTVSYMSIEDFSVYIEDYRDIGKVLESLEELLKNSQKLKKINIKVSNYAHKHVQAFADLVMKYVRLGKIQYFAGYDLKLLMENKIDTLEIRNSEKAIYTDEHKNQEILCEIFRQLLPNAGKVTRIVSHNYKCIYNIKELIESVIETKTLDLKKLLYYNCPLFFFSVICYSSRYKGLKKLIIKNAFVNSCRIAFSNILKELTSLQTLKLGCFKNYMNLNFSKISKVINSYLPELSYIKFITYIMDSKVIYKMFNNLVSNSSLRKFKIENISFKNRKWETITALANFIASSKLVSLNFSLTYFALTYDELVILNQAFELNQTITHLNIDSFSAETDNYSEIRNQKYDTFVVLLSLQSKSNYEKISIFYEYNYKPENTTIDEYSLLFLERVTNILLNNQRLRVFNVQLESYPSCSFYYKYIEVLLNAIKRNKNLEIVNGIDVKDFFSNEKIAVQIAIEYFQYGTNYLKNIRSWRKLRINYELYDEYISVYLSELVKSSSPGVVNYVVKLLFGKETNAKSLNFNIENSKIRYYEELVIYMLNFIDAFSGLEELVLTCIDITAYEIDVIMKNIKNLDCLRILKLVECKNIKKYSSTINIADISRILEVKNLFYLKIYRGMLSPKNLTKFAEINKFSRLEKLAIKNIQHIDLDAQTYFQQLFDIIICPFIKTLKIHIKYTPYILNLLIERLSAFENLEYFSVNILENYSNYQISLGNIISMIKNRKSLISKIKVCKYTWDILKLQEKENLEFVGCRLNPADLMIFAGFCEERIVENVETINFSENAGVVDDNFIGNMVKVIRDLGCKTIIMENSGCEQEHINQIKSLLGDENTLCSFVVS